MNNDYGAIILADSVSPDGVRLTTVQAAYPRFIHSEMLRHRVFAHSVASSRAIPTERQIAKVIERAFVPETFGKRVKGMGYGEGLAEEELEMAKDIWLEAAGSAARLAQALNELGIDKSRANRLLEPFIVIDDIITGTEWENFFALRQPRNSDPVPQSTFPAQPEFQIVARMMRDEMLTSVPRTLAFGEWHMPYTDDLPGLPPSAEIDWDFWGHVSAGRCAKVSFDTHEIYEAPELGSERAKKLKTDGHMSPFEHVARPISDQDMDPEWGDPIQNKLMIPLASAKRAVHGGLRAGDVWCGHLRGWVPLRKQIPNEDNFGELIAA
jgi:hypothetical protein